ncbi:sodium-dependent lysophosphatidylcholine symporter 1-B-like isoform X3 [Pomacea canaliculata]|uniref:sodium-dependent lysophosphatidylcholine symporter 1-B-like isoform X3 n=1 Tax=Pomacea canaliculata TaxID=400727 RepID=UPI000D727D61|nr:sodium-dependent lysophosphatidylcholine symporter 1-B-like isoform X3 [Pomacea canaliculata]
MANHGYSRVGPESSLPLWRKLCFAVGGVPYQMTSTVIGFFLNIFLLEVAEVKPSYVAVVLFSGKAWDAVTDPACGYLVQRTSSRWGKMRPWILFSAPFSCAAYFMLFFVPWRYQEVDHRSETEASMEEKLAYYFVIFCLFQGFLTALHVPYTALTMYVTTQQKERDSITAYRMWFEALGVLAAVVIQGQLVQSTRCTDDDDDTSVTVQDMEDREWSYRIGSFVVIGIYLICSCTVFFGVKEEKDDRTDGDSSGLFKGLKLVFSFTPYLKAAMTFLFLSLAVGIVQGNVALYTTHSLKLAGVYFCHAGVAVRHTPFWQKNCICCWDYNSDAHLHLPDVRPREKHGAVFCGHRFCRPWRLCLSPPALVRVAGCAGPVHAGEADAEGRAVLCVLRLLQQAGAGAGAGHLTGRPVVWGLQDRGVQAAGQRWPDPPPARDAGPCGVSVGGAAVLVELPHHGGPQERNPRGGFAVQRSAQ